MRSLWLLLPIALIGLVMRFHNLTEVLVNGRVYFLDGDCYSRMARAQMVARDFGTVVHFQRFENWPEGVASHATAPMDYAVVTLDKVLRVVWPQSGRLGALAGETLDLAGALISPMLGVLLCVCAGVWAQSLRDEKGAVLSGWWLVPLLIAVSPPLVHATVFGRPDHQSLIVVLVGLALMGERRLLEAGGRVSNIVTGVLWGGALWVSLFEPLILLLGASVAGALFGGRFWARRERAFWAGAIGLMVAVAWLVEGKLGGLPGAAFGDSLLRWGRTIGELRAVGSLNAAVVWCGALVLFAPLVWFIAWRRETGARRSALLAQVTVFVGILVLALWQVRWGVYAALCFAFAIPWMLGYVRSSWLGGLVGVLCLWPVFVEWERLWFPDAKEVEWRHMERSERINARLAAERMKSADVLPFIAPWWLSPALSYWSGQPAVAGSGHEGIAGIVDSARFYLSEDMAEAREILERRGVRVVVAADPYRARLNSTEILGVEPRSKPLCEKLWESSFGAQLGLVGEKNVTTFRLFYVVPRDGE